jgi:DNA repair protein RadC
MAREEKENLHKGHRQRVKERYLAEGLETFEDHQVLELLLYYAIPYRDVNGLAHRLLQRYGSLSAVLEADYYDLKTEPGIGDNAAMLLSMLPSVSRVYQLDKWGKRPTLDSTEALGEYAVSLFTGRTYEFFYLICLDARNRVNHAALIHEGSINEVAIYPRIVVETAIRHKAKNVVLVHNHPGGSLRPTSSDMDLTWRLIDIMKDISIGVVDHIIVSNSAYLSFAEKGLLIK